MQWGSKTLAHVTYHSGDDKLQMRTTVTTETKGDNWSEAYWFVTWLKLDRQGHVGHTEAYLVQGTRRLSQVSLPALDGFLVQWLHTPPPPANRTTHIVACFSIIIIYWQGADERLPLIISSCRPSYTSDVYWWLASLFGIKLKSEMLVTCTLKIFLKGKDRYVSFNHSS